MNQINNSKLYCQPFWSQYKPTGATAQRADRPPLLAIYKGCLPDDCLLLTKIPLDNYDFFRFLGIN
jgi:hypothetical protein